MELQRTLQVQKERRSFLVLQALLHALWTSQRQIKRFVDRDLNAAANIHLVGTSVERPLADRVLRLKMGG